MKNRIGQGMKPAVIEAERLGFTVGFTKKRHMRFSKPGCVPVYTSGTPSCYRAAKNAIAMLRRSDKGIM